MPVLDFSQQRDLLASGPSPKMSRELHQVGCPVSTEIIHHFPLDFCQPLMPCCQFQSV